MSGSDSDNPKSDLKLKSSKDEEFKLLEIEEIAGLEQPTILDYIRNLHKLLNKKEKSLKKYKDKVKKLLKQADKLKAASPQKLAADELTKTTTSETTLETATTTASFVDEIRQAAEQAQSLSDFVYEPTSGLYYDQKTGYYYNAEYGLYYDGHTGCYYKYNQEKNAFEFHSQVEVQPNQQAAMNGLNKDNKNNDADNDDDDDDDDLMEDVQFDEHGGVITDQEKLHKLRKEKRRKQRELEKAKRKKKKSRKSKDKKSKRALSKKSKKSKKAKKHKKSSADSQSDDEKNIIKIDMEDGELSESASESSSSSSSGSEIGTDSDIAEINEDSNVPLFKSAGRFQDIAKKYPPSLRIIVQETNVESLKVGSLSLITFKGGSLGREGDHDVIIPDVNVSKSHLEFTYDRKSGIYKCVDLGSRNGTILNGSRMCEPKVASESLDLVHGSVIQIGQTKLLCHTHEGNSTCGLCEPGLLIDASTDKEISGPATHLTHKEQLKKLQRKYGLENEKFVDGQQQGNAGNSYKDRAASRRIKVGSSSGNEKTQTASVMTAISSENKGFKMLSKLGWSEGEALGKSQANSGLLEPINVSANEGKKGLGCEEPTAPNLTKAEQRKIEAAKKMQERYSKAKKTTDIFTLSDDSS